MDGLVDGLVLVGLVVVVLGAVVVVVEVLAVAVVSVGPLDLKQKNVQKIVRFEIGKPCEDRISRDYDEGPFRPIYPARTKIVLREKLMKNLTRNRKIVRQRIFGARHLAAVSNLKVKDLLARQTVLLGRSRLFRKGKEKN